MTLEALLIPKQADIERPGALPKAVKAQETVKLADKEAERAKFVGPWLLAEHLSRQYLPKPAPKAICPGLTHGKTCGHWLGDRRRRLTASETARLQGFTSKDVLWTVPTTQAYALLGNTMALCVVQRITIALLVAIGYRIEDPWLSNRAQQRLADDARGDKLPPRLRIPPRVQERPRT